MSDIGIFDYTSKNTLDRDTQFYVDGKSAYAHGCTRDDNPYGEELGHTMWNRGYSYAEMYDVL